MTAVKVWQERVEIPTYETGPQDIHPMFLENRVYQGSSGAVYPYGVTDTLSEQKTLKSKIAFIRDRPARFIPTA